MSRKNKKRTPPLSIETITTSSSTRFKIISLLAVLLITLIAFFPALQNGFVNWDDTEYIEKNYFIKSFTAENLKEIFTGYFIANYQPLTILSYAIEYHFTQLNPQLYHFTNLIFHLMNTALVLWFIFLLTKKMKVAVVTALLFGIHPMHVESVAWVAERKDVLYTFFYLLTCVYYFFYFTSEKPKTKFYIISLLMFLLSLLSKAMAITLPMVLLLIDFYSGRKFSRKSILEKIPFFLLSLIFGYVAILAQQKSHAIRNDTLFTILDRILLSCYQMTMYLWKLILPVNLTCFYPYPEKTNNMLPVIFYLTPVILLLLALAIYYFRKNKNVLFGSLFFLFQIGLVLQFFPLGSTIIAERFTYLSYIGLFFIAGQTIYSFQQTILFQKIKIPMAIAGGILIIILVSLTRERCKIWKDNLTLWKDALHQYLNPFSYSHIGFNYHAQGNYDSAMYYYNQGIAIYPEDEYSYANRGDLYLRVQQYPLALADINKALDLNPEFELALNTKAALLFQLNQPDSAIIYFNKTIALKKDYWEICFNRGNVYSSLGKYELALADYNTYLYYYPEDGDVYYWRGLAEMNLAKPNEAINDFNNALRWNSTFKPEIYFSRSKSFEMKKQYQNALQDAMMAKSWGYKLDESYLESLNCENMK